MRTSDTIVAISSAVASASSPAARMIVRLAGPEATTLMASLLPLPLREGLGGGVSRAAILQPALSDEYVRTPHPSPLPQGERGPNAASAGRFQVTIDGLVASAWIYAFRAPRSYTGDDLVELHLPGNALLAELAVQQFIAAGARLAEPGEFTARAYLNGRLDLAAAEGVALAISARQQGELRAARQLMSGELARRLKPNLELLAGSLALLETGIDFSDQDVSFIDAAEVRRRTTLISVDLQQLLTDSPQIQRLDHRPRFVLMGQPNAGKSTLLNALAKSHRAVVSSVAGTTRDVLSADVVLQRGIVEVIDTAGRESAGNSAIQQQMQAHAARAIAESDFTVHVIDASVAPARDSTAEHPSGVPGDIGDICDIVVWNKVDLLSTGVPSGVLAISAQRGDGLAELQAAMDRLAFGVDVASPRLAMTARHRAAIVAAMQHLSAAAVVAEVPELAAHDLRAALDSLGEVLGQITPDDVLGRVFATFCIGK